jgi:hypothetical protein
MHATITNPEPAIHASMQESLAWLWLLLCASAVLLVMFHFAALIPVGLVWAGVGIVKRMTATGPRSRAAGTGLTIAGLMLATVSALLLLTLLGGSEPTLVNSGFVDVQTLISE